MKSQLFHLARFKMWTNWSGGDSSEVIKQTETFHLLLQAQKAMKTSTDNCSLLNRTRKKCIKLRATHRSI